MLPEAIQKFAAGQKVRRLTLFEKLDKNPDSVGSRRLVTASGQYGLTKGGYQAEFLELTPEGGEATSEVVAPAKKLQARFNLAIKNHAPFNFLYEKLKGNKMPAKEVMADLLAEANVEDDERAECIDTFVLNAKFLRLLRTIAGSERIIPLEQALDEAPSAPVRQPDQPSGGESGATQVPALPSAASVPTEPVRDFAKICFYISPIGEENTEERHHADFLMEYIIKPAVKEFDLTVIRADQMGKPGAEFPVVQLSDGVQTRAAAQSAIILGLLRDDVEQDPQAVHVGKDNLPLVELADVEAVVHSELGPHPRVAPATTAITASARPSGLIRREDSVEILAVDSCLLLYPHAVAENLAKSSKPTGLRPVSFSTSPVTPAAKPARTAP